LVNPENSTDTAAPVFTRASVMRVGLFIPCYMDAFEPGVGIATLKLLERLECTVEYPYDQTCCGQPMTNAGCHREAVGAEDLFVRNFAGYDYIVAPFGSCVHQVRANMTSVWVPHSVNGAGAISSSSLADHADGDFSRTDPRARCCAATAVCVGNDPPSHDPSSTQVALITGSARSLYSFQLIDQSMDSYQNSESEMHSHRHNKHQDAYLDAHNLFCQ
jgi:Cysteine-rich domain